MGDVIPENTFCELIRSDLEVTLWQLKTMLVNSMKLKDRSFTLEYKASSALYSMNTDVSQVIEIYFSSCT